MTRQTVRRWGVGLLVTVALVGMGLLYARGLLLAASLVGLTYVLYGTLSTLPETVELSATRTMEPQSPAPGAHVTVELTVTNEGETVLPDLRLVDGVPEALRVVEGSPRLGAPLSPGESRTVTYTVVAKRGAYEFEEPVVRLRSLAGVDRETASVAVEGNDRLVCAPTLSDPPGIETTTPHTGTVTADSGGSGLEFYSTRQYKHGDPVNRIDWRHVAKTGEFITVQFREERTSNVVVLVDVRPVGRVTPAAGYPTVADLCTYAAEQLYDTLDSAGMQTSVGVVGIEDDDLRGPDGLAWVEYGEQHPELLFRAARRAATGDAAQLPLDPPPVEFDDSDGRAQPSGEMSGGRSTRARTDGGAGDIERLLARLPADAQVVVCTPLLDNWGVSLTQALTGRGYETLVVTPDGTGGDQQGQRVAALHRDLRLDTLQRLGARTVNWAADEPIDHALRRSLPKLLGGTAR